MARKDGEILNGVVGLLRFANGLNKIEGEIRGEIFRLEQIVKENMAMRKWSHIMLHHSLTKDGETVSWQAIRKWHTGRNPESPYKWDDIGYHFGVELVNDEYEILMGRDLGMNGAHCYQQEMNQKAIGVCFVGNFDDSPPPEDQWKAGLKLVRGLMAALDIPIVGIVGHRDYAPKSCPGRMFGFEKFKQDLR